MKPQHIEGILITKSLDGKGGLVLAFDPTSSKEKYREVEVALLDKSQARIGSYVHFHLQKDQTYLEQSETAPGGACPRAASGKTSVCGRHVQVITAHGGNCQVGQWLPIRWYGMGASPGFSAKEVCFGCVDGEAWFLSLQKDPLDDCKSEQRNKSFPPPKLHVTI